MLHHRECFAWAVWGGAGVTGAALNTVCEACRQVPAGRVAAIPAGGLATCDLLIVTHEHSAAHMLKKRLLVRCPRLALRQPTSVLELAVCCNAHYDNATLSSAPEQCCCAPWRLLSR